MPAQANAQRAYKIVEVKMNFFMASFYMGTEGGSTVNSNDSHSRCRKSHNEWLGPRSDKKKDGGIGLNRDAADITEAADLEREG